MSSFGDAIEQREDLLLISLEVQAGSGRKAFPTGYNVWRKAIGIAVTAPPIGGRANAEIIDLVAEVLGVHRLDVALISGHQSRRKVIGIIGVDTDEVCAILGSYIDKL
ncbi:MAG: YggU family protein [Methanocalculus sp. MSAO_Arc2]|uniref:DUF167 domain-containing protein n=1 Tax=Methanocalculus sp. MSAO_Arc2 TaxID=2293855 RepID=UPI000FEEFF63|nr:MAG: YggU family protein [Methanocalculus sp. MSAO_Arc2]